MNNRPLGVTLVSIIAWISGVVQTIGGIFAVIFGLFITPTALVGWLSLLVGVITIIVGVGLWRGNGTARTVATVVFIINIAIAVFSAVRGDSLWSAFVSAALAVIGLILLYTRNATRFFRS